MNSEAESEQIAGMVGMRRSSREFKKMFVGTNLLHKTLFFESHFSDDKDANPKWTRIQLEIT